MYAPCEWSNRLAFPDAEFRRALADTYGSDPALIRERVRLLCEVVDRFGQRFGNRPMRLFRCPGRINLRGMHVDTHGGYLNLMTHQREVVAAVTPATEDRFTFANTDPLFPEVSFHVQPFVSLPGFGGDWMRFIMGTEVRALTDADRGHWGNYLKGSALSIQHRFPQCPLAGMAGVIGSDLPRGAALSSSAALCMAVCLAVLQCNGLSLTDEELITAARDAEWFTGSRCGLSDQAAMVLGHRDELVNVALYAPQLDTATARRLHFPEDLAILVANSYTERSLSGRALVDYTRNRFAYSLAMEILRQEMRVQRVPEDLIARMDRLAHVTPDVLAPAGGGALLLRLLRAIPEELSVDDLRGRYHLPNLDDAYHQYFGTVSENLRPTRIGLRGPLLFGIAESERARRFFEAIAAGDFARAGRLMSVGHDGDRRVGPDGRPYVYEVGDEALERLIQQRVPIEMCPGGYGAGSPVLDALVDAALRAGALGASLTGAGMAGSVLALCRADDADRVAEAIRDRIRAPDYPALSNRATPLSQDEIGRAVVLNRATAAAAELRRIP